MPPPLALQPPATLEIIMENALRERDRERKRDVARHVSFAAECMGMGNEL